MIPLAQTPQPD